MAAISFYMFLSSFMLTFGTPVNLFCYPLYELSVQRNRYANFLYFASYFCFLIDFLLKDLNVRI